MDVSSTAAVLGSISSVTPQDLLVLVVSVVLAFLMAPAVQASIEAAIASALPVWAFFAKPFIPSVMASALGYLANLKGLPVADAVIGAAVLARATHWVNSQPWASNIEGQYPKVWNLFKGFDTKPPAALLVLAFLAMGAGLHAATSYDLSLGSPLGSSAWEVVDGGKVVSSGSTLAGSGLVLSYGADDVAGKYTPYIALLGGFGGETRNGDNYFVGFIGAGPVIPGTSTPLVVGPCWRLFSGQQYPAILVATSIQWGQSLWHK